MIFVELVCAGIVVYVGIQLIAWLIHAVWCGLSTPVAVVPTEFRRKPGELFKVILIAGIRAGLVAFGLMVPTLALVEVCRRIFGGGK